MKANELNGTHIGMTIAVSVDGSACTDLLAGVQHEGDIITEARLMRELPSYYVGRTATHLTFARFGTVTVSGGTEVEVAAS